MGCELKEPDCFNCPYDDCIASTEDIKRQWRNYRIRARDNADNVPKIVKQSQKARRIR